MFGYPREVRRAIYTTNAIESLNMTLRTISKNRALFPSDEAAGPLSTWRCATSARNGRCPSASGGVQ